MFSGASVLPGLSQEWGNSLGYPNSNIIQLRAEAEGPGERCILINYLSSALCPGTRAEVTSDQVANVMWDFFTQISNNAKEAVEQIQNTDVTQKLK